MSNQNCYMSKVSVLNCMSSYSPVKLQLLVETAEGSQAGDPWPAGRVRGGEEWLPGNNPAAGEGGPATSQPAGTHGAPGTPWLQLQQPGPLEERSCVGRGQCQLEGARCDGAENNTAFRFNMWQGQIDKRLCVFCTLFPIHIIPLSFSLIAVAPKPSACRGLAADAGETVSVCQCSHSLSWVLSHTETLWHSLTLVWF